MSRIERRRRLIIMGAGRQGRNINDICQVLEIEVVGFLDDTKAPGENINGVPVLGGFDRAQESALIEQAEWIVGIGENVIRRRLCQEIESRGGTLATIIHPACARSPSAVIGKGVYINAFSRLLANTRVGDYALIEGLSSIGTDSVLEEAVLIGPGCQLTAGCRIGACALIGAGAVVLGGAPVGRHSIIGAGATVASEIPDYVLAVGTPARVKRQLPRGR